MLGQDFFILYLKHLGSQLQQVLANGNKGAQNLEGHFVLPDVLELAFLLPPI